MIDPFRKLILDTVSLRLKSEAGAESLVELLSVTTPGFSADQVSVKATRAAAFRALQLRVHPDKHSEFDSSDDAKVLFQDVTAFYEKCCNLIDGGDGTGANRKRKRGHPCTKKQAFPQNFHISDRWKHLQDYRIQSNVNNCPRPGTQVSVTCKNIRSQIAHGKIKGLSYTCNKGRDLTVAAEFNRGGGGTKRLDSVDEIKEELMKRGPVVSTSFVLTKDFLNVTNNAAAFRSSHLESRHPVLIVGWKLTAFGEMWLLQNLCATNLHDIDANISIGVSQFFIEDEVIAPLGNFEEKYWQRGPYLHIDLSRCREWRTWTGFTHKLSDIQFKELAAAYPGGFIEAYNNKTKVELCNSKKHCESKACYLKEFSYDTTSKMWSVELGYL